MVDSQENKLKLIFDAQQRQRGQFRPIQDDLAVDYNI
jgi:hypothetical protein